MSALQRFAAYAAAFEKAYANDDWSVVEPFFTEDAVYDAGLPALLAGRIEGRDAILAYFPDVLDRFDRRFASRRVELVEGPREDGDAVWLRGRAIYTADGAPDLAFELEETARFTGDRIRRLEDLYTDDEKDRLAAYMREHGARLGLGGASAG
jgi:ketosteroid isomerase-like protein